jgi:outer membrane protein assembly factor BamB
MRQPAIAIATAVLALAACSKDEKVDPPAELVDFRQTLEVKRGWSETVGGGEETMRLGLGGIVVGDRFFAAGHGGSVVAIGLENGRVLWRTDTRAELSGGTGADAQLVVVGSNDGDVIALSAADGVERWRARVRGEVLSAPLVTSAGVYVRSVDGRLVALAPGDGKELWTIEQPSPRLTLRGTSPPAAGGDLVLAGFDNGKVVAAHAGDGAVAWESAVAPPRGRTELERLSDIDAGVQIAGTDVFAVGFQGRAAMLALETGQIWWSRDISSHRGLAIDADNVYVATSQGEVASFRRTTGAEVWRQTALLNRGLSAPAVVGSHIAVADFEGYVHFLDKATGDIAARVESGGARVSTPPIVADGLLIVVNDEGRISTFRPQG